MNEKTLTKAQLIWGIVIWIVIFGVANWRDIIGTDSLIQILSGPVIITSYYFSNFSTKKKSRDKSRDEEPIVDERIEQRVRHRISSIALPFLGLTLALVFMLESIFHIQSISTRFIELYVLLACLGLIIIAAIVRRR